MYQTNPFRVAYFYNEEIGKFYYSKDHPMKPKRVAMTHSLIQSFDIYKQMDIYKSRLATRQELLKFHHPEYIKYLENYISKDILKSNGFEYNNDILLTMDQERKQLISNSKKKNQFHLGETGDCPGFYGLYEFCQLSCGGSIDSANVLMTGQADITINWGGGLHHAKKCEASGFCYTNDIVLAILQLLKFHPRVLYLDIDVHHGDGVEQAFFLTNRVMTVSFHQYQTDFFPGTGGLDSIGQGPGKYYALNVPLRTGIDDQTFYSLFVDVMDNVMAKYRPGAIVMQLGADSLANDKLGNLNLTVKGHGNCLSKMMSYGLPLMMLGGGGYTVQNVARCWAYQTGLAVGQKLQGNIPKADRFYESYLPDNKLHQTIKSAQNKNTPQYLNNIRMKIGEHLQQLECSPGVPFHNVPTGTFEGQGIQQQQEASDDEVQRYIKKLLSKRERIVY